MKKSILTAILALGCIYGASSAFAETDAQIVTGYLVSSSNSLGLYPPFKSGESLNVCHSNLGTSLVNVISHYNRHVHTPITDDGLWDYVAKACNACPGLVDDNVSCIVQGIAEAKTAGDSQYFPTCPDGCLD
jgi:hypothetical protein